ncbi:hypothetical protein L486_07800 [Kwoniella mangroviensis CBS 10435]|uniref:Securin n=1 Tax=Kwoniella mangroviensis CBS 10435 TaxID=1331196 RepID=A0A1B9IG67_9TREE|nr:hypothetical protein L486_07800 [Kwoniella mangroviensis CBS 10435]
MASRRQHNNENLIHPVRRAGGVVHTLSSANKIKSTSSHTKENILTSKSTSTSKNVSDKTLRESKKRLGAGKLTEPVDDKQTLQSSRKVLDLKGSSVKPFRSALSLKSTGSQSSQLSLKPRIAATPSSRPKHSSISAQTQTPSQVRSGKLESTLNIYTPGPSTSNISKPKSKSREKIDEGQRDDIDEVEYMPPDTKDPQDDGLLPPLQSTSSVNMDLDLDLDLDLDNRMNDLHPIEIPGNTDLSFELDLPPNQDVLRVDTNEQARPQDDFLLDL